MTDAEIVARLDHGHTVGITIYGEARDQSIEGRVAVANVIRHRVLANRASFGYGFREVCLKAKQFSCWLPSGGPANYQAVMEAARGIVDGHAPTSILRECLWIADGLMVNAFGDNVRNSTHYLTLALFRVEPPAWAKGREPTVRVKDHVFFADVA